jgi:tetraacyldisaccharide 4'-kinase
VGRRLEDRTRLAWRGYPGAALRGAEALFATGAEIRHFLYDAGVLGSRPGPLPIVSVGGLTVGGSGKTPLAAELARWLQRDGHTVGVLTRGYPDEMALHRRLTPGALVLGHPERRVAAMAATASGATVAVLDDGFQHRRLARDLEIVVVDLDALHRTNRRRLPAGPFRDSFRALVRADAIVISRRDQSGSGSTELGEWIERRFPATTARCTLQPGARVAVNQAAEDRDEPDPAVALTGIMKPNLFFEQVTQECRGVARCHVFPDHATPDDEELESVIEEAGPQGMVTTGKDIAGIANRVSERVPLWFLSERIVWESGQDSLRRRVRELGSA